MRQVRRIDSSLLAKNGELIGGATEGLKKRHAILQHCIAIIARSKSQVQRHGQQSCQIESISRRKPRAENVSRWRTQ
jgi:hypothetical protein